MDIHDADGPKTALTIRTPGRVILANETYEIIKALVMNHDIRPGARVNIEALARDLGVSATPIREALARLESDGLVVKKPMRGSWTTPLLNLREFNEQHELRLLLEPWSCRQAAEKMTDQGRGRLLEEVAAGVPVPAGSDYDTYKSVFEHDARFHELIFELAGNKLVQLVWNRTHCHLHLFRLYYAQRLGTMAVQEHREVADALLARDPDLAENAMRRHLEASRHRLLPTIARNEVSVRQVRGGSPRMAQST